MKVYHHSNVKADYHQQFDSWCDKDSDVDLVSPTLSLRMPNKTCFAPFCPTIEIGGYFHKAPMHRGFVRCSKEGWRFKSMTAGYPLYILMER